MAKIHIRGHMVVPLYNHSNWIAYHPPKNKMKSTIRLFKALPIKTKRKKQPSKELLQQTIRRGFIFSPEVVANYPDTNALIKLVETEVGLTPEQLTSTFHKSWKKVAETDMTQLVMEQILHYFTTYGFEAMGIYDSDSVYIPRETLEIPELDVDAVKLTVIHGLTKKELKEKLLNLLKMGVALKEETKEDIIDVASFVELTDEEVYTIRNKEVKIMLYESLNIIPKNPIEFMRYLMYTATGQTLILKSARTFYKIREDAKPLKISTLFTKYKRKYGLEKLSEIFYRFKPLFLALRLDTKSKQHINKIRKLAVKNHKPMPENYLNHVTSKLRQGKRIVQKELKEELAKVNTFRKVRLARALKFRTLESDSIVYNIRNGKSYAKEFSFHNQDAARRVLDIVLDSIATDMKKNVKGKKIYIPENIHYALPATQKQFTDNFPSGTYVDIPKDALVGVHWNNLPNKRVDLDLSLIKTEGKIGWDSTYRSEEGDALFSGDIVDARGPNGATEFFYVKRGIKEASLLLLNYFNFRDNEQTVAPFKIVIAQEQVSNFGKNYMVNPNNVITIAKSTMEKKQKVIGLLVSTTNGCRFYFTESYVGNSISSSSTEYVKQSRDYLVNYSRNPIKLEDVLIKAGAKLVKKPSTADIDLSPESLEKDTILNLFKKG